MNTERFDMEGAAAHFRELLLEQQKRAHRIQQQQQKVLDFTKLSCIKIALAGGDGIGPHLIECARTVLEKLLGGEIECGKIKLLDIPGLALESRLAQNNPAATPVPQAVLKQLEGTHVLLKGPTTTPPGGGKLNLESANITLRRHFDLYANVRPVRLPEKGIDWCFFRENTEGAYILGSRGLHLKGLESGSELAFDFALTSRPGVERIARAAMQYAKNAGKTRVSIVTKANIVKAGDGQFLEICREIAGREFRELQVDDWYIDIMAANLLNEELQGRFEVFVLPNLYGDILSDEAAQIQGGLGTAGSANIGSNYAMFEPVHGSAPRLIAEGRTDFIDPRSILRSSSMLLRHIGYAGKALRLDAAISQAAALYPITGFANAAKTSDFMRELLLRL